MRAKKLFLPSWESLDDEHFGQGVRRVEEFTSLVAVVLRVSIRLLAHPVDDLGQQEWLWPAQNLKDIDSSHKNVKKIPLTRTLRRPPPSKLEYAVENAMKRLLTRGTPTLTRRLQGGHDAGGEIGVVQRSLGGEIPLAVQGHIAPEAPPSPIEVIFEESVLLPVHFRRPEDGGVGEFLEHGLLAKPL